MDFLDTIKFVEEAAVLSDQFPGQAKWYNKPNEIIGAKDLIHPNESIQMPNGISAIIDKYELSDDYFPKPGTVLDYRQLHDIMITLYQIACEFNIPEDEIVHINKLFTDSVINTKSYITEENDNPEYTGERFTHEQDVNLINGWFESTNIFGKLGLELFDSFLDGENDEFLIYVVEGQSENIESLFAQMKTRFPSLDIKFSLQNDFCGEIVINY